MIPPTLHFCWFGSIALPAAVERCIETWRCHMPDAEIVRWSENTWDVESNAFALANLRRKKYAFVSDVCRLDALRDHGGIYLDTDVVMKKGLDPFRRHSAFLGMMYSDSVGTAVIGAEAGHPLIVGLRRLYDDLPVTDTPNNDLVTGYLLKSYPSFVLGDHLQSLGDGAVLYPRHYFERFSVHPCKGYTQHLVSNTWHDTAAAPREDIDLAPHGAVLTTLRERIGNARTIPKAAHFDAWLRHTVARKRPDRPADGIRSR